MKIAKLKAQDESYYNELALKHGTIFNTHEWTNIFSNNIRKYGIYSKKGELLGGFFTYKERKFGMSFYRNPPCTPTIGPFIKIESKKHVTLMDNWKKVLQLMADFFDKIPFSVLSASLDKCVVDTQPFYWKNFKVIPGFTYVIDLAQSQDDIWGGFSTAHRNHVKKAIKDSLVVKQIHDMRTVESLVLKTFSRQDKRANHFYIKKILFEFSNKNNSFAFATFRNDVPIACSFCIYDLRTSYNLLSGYDHDNKHHGAGCMNIWESIKYAKKLGLQLFDFEGSMIPPIERYFRGFGGQMVTYYKINKAVLPLEILLKFKKRNLF